MASTERRSGTRKGVRYRGKYRDPSGRKRSGPWVSSKREALRWAQDEEAKIRAGTWQDAGLGKMTLDVYFSEHWLPNRRQEVNTRRFYRSMYSGGMSDSLGPLPVRGITRPVVERWITAQLSQGVEPGVVRARFKALQTILAGTRGVSAIRDGLIRDNPCAGVSLPPLHEREVKVYSVQEVHLICEALGAWWAPLAMLAADTGLRWGELMGLTVGACHLDGTPFVVVARTIIEVSKKDTNNGTAFMWKDYPKGRRSRRVALSPESVELIRRLIEDRRLDAPSDRLFSPPSRKGDGLPLRTPEWPEGRPVFRNTFSDLFRDAHEEAGIERNGRSFHNLRSSHLTWLLAGGADLATVMERAGHREIATTQVYLAALHDADTRALDALAATKARYSK